MNIQKPVIRPINPEEKICYNCKYMIWAVALGVGVLCRRSENKNPDGKLFKIPNRFHTCEYFEYKVEPTL